MTVVETGGSTSQKNIFHDFQWEIMYASTCYFAPVQETMGDEVDFGWARMVFLKGPGIG
jgi:hypothetical protein